MLPAAQASVAIASTARSSRGPAPSSDAAMGAATPAAMTDSRKIRARAGSGARPEDIRGLPDLVRGAVGPAERLTDDVSTRGGRDRPPLAGVLGPQAPEDRERVQLGPRVGLAALRADLRARRKVAPQALGQQLGVLLAGRADDHVLRAVDDPETLALEALRERRRVRAGAQVDADLPLVVAPLAALLLLLGLAPLALGLDGVRRLRERHVRGLPALLLRVPAPDLRAHAEVLGAGELLEHARGLARLLLGARVGEELVVIVVDGDDHAVAEA